MYKLKVDPDFIDQRNAEMAQNGRLLGELLLLFAIWMLEGVVKISVPCND